MLISPALYRVEFFFTASDVCFHRVSSPGARVVEHPGWCFCCRSTEGFFLRKISSEISPSFQCKFPFYFAREFHTEFPHELGIRRSYLLALGIRRVVFSNDSSSPFLAAACFFRRFQAVPFLLHKFAFSCLCTSSFIAEILSTLWRSCVSPFH